MSKRRIKHNIAPDFLYEGPIARRTRRHGSNFNSQGLIRRMVTRSNPIEENDTTEENREPQQDEIPGRENVEQDRQVENTGQNQEINQNESLTASREESLDDLLSKIYRMKESPAAYSAAVQNFIDKNYSLSLHKQRRKRFRYDLIT